MNFHKKTVIALLGLLCCSFLAQAKEYHILLTNDDGITYPGIIALAESLSDDFKVTVSAPAKNMSGNSHATNIFKGPFKVDKSPLKGNFTSFAVHGTPSDAVRFGIVQMRNAGTPVDLVISGINPGSNIGSLSHLSGTIGAAMEAQYYDLPAIALNLDRASIKDTGYIKATDMAKKAIALIREKPLPKGVILNINIPHHSKGIKVVPMGPSIMDVRSYEKTGETYTADILYPDPAPEEVSNDSDAYLNGYTTLTPLKLDWTAHKSLSHLKSWNLK